MQPCRLNVNSSGTLLGSCTASVPSGNVLDLTTGFNYGSGDNGNVMSWAAVGQQTFNRSYTYDGVNRLHTMSAPGSTCSGLSWSYDQWANRTAQTVTGGTCGSSQLTFNSYNHVTNSGFQYDAAGNMTHDASHSYTYDAENHITKVDGGSTATYQYDPNGRRVSKVASGVETDYLYDLSGHVVETYGGGCGSTCLNTAFVYLNGQLLAQYTSGTTYFVSADHLGSTRLVTGYPTPSVVDSMDYLPFGEQIAGGTGTTHKFTGYERDSETGLDNAQARYNSSAMGRFMSPDPVGIFVADATNPQSWNLYAYVNNSPLAFVDPSGLDGLDSYRCMGGSGGNDCGGILMNGGLYGTGSFYGLNEFDAMSVLVVGEQFSFGQQFYVGGDFKGIDYSFDDGDGEVSFTWGATNADSFAMLTQTYTLPALIGPTSSLGPQPPTPDDYIRAISGALKPLNKLADCAALAAADQVPLGRKVIGAPEGGSDPVGGVLDAADRLSDAKNAGRVALALDKAGLPVLGATMGQALSKTAGALMPYAGKINAAGLLWAGGKSVHDTYTCYNKGGG